MMDRKQYERITDGWMKDINPKPDWEERERLLSQYRAKRNRAAFHQWAKKLNEEAEK